MGWSFFSNKSQEELIQYLVSSESNQTRSRKTVTFCLIKNETDYDVLWSVVECKHMNTGEVVRYIECNLLDKLEGDWGYKGMDESMRPLYYSCPLSYLDLVSTVGSQSWRDKVRTYHRSYTEGQWVSLNDCSIPRARIVSTDPLIGMYKGCYFRLSRDVMGDL